MKVIPNCISTCRILLSLFLIRIEPFSIAFYLIYLICGFSDMADGYIARKTGTTSKLGEKLDSLADLFMVGALFVLLYPIINPGRPIIIWVIVIAVIRALSLVVSRIKYKTFSSLHTYANKITGMVLFAFPIALPYILTDILMYVICAIASISAIEELIIQVTATELKANRKSILVK